MIPWWLGLLLLVPVSLRALAQAELEGVLKLAEDIRDAAKSGWY